LFFKNWRKKLWAKVDVITFLKSALEPGKTLIIILPMHTLPRLILARKCSSRPLIKRPGKTLLLSLPDGCPVFILADNSFDTVIGSFVFCSVPMPVKGLKSCYRVCKRASGFITGACVEFKTCDCKSNELINPAIVALVGAISTGTRLKMLKPVVLPQCVLTNAAVILSN